MDLNKGKLGLTKYKMGLTKGEIGLSKGKMGLNKGKLGLTKGKMGLNQGKMGFNKGELGRTLTVSIATKGYSSMMSRSLTNSSSRFDCHTSCNVIVPSAPPPPPFTAAAPTAPAAVELSIVGVEEPLLGVM